MYITIRYIMTSRLRNISVTQARKELGDVFSEVNYNKERIVIDSQRGTNQVER